MPVEKQRRYIEIKAVDGSEEGTFTGLLSSYGKVDQGNDSIERGAYTKTIHDNKGQIPILFNHSPEDAIGMAELIDTDEGLMIKGKLLLGVQRAAETYQLIKAGVMKGLSIGFKALQQERKDGVRYLREIKLYESSVVLWGMDPTAMITSVKSLQDGTSDFTEELTEMQAACAGSQMLSVLQDGLCNAWWSVGSSYNPIDPAVRLRFCEGMIDEFKAAFLDAMSKFSAIAEDPEDQDEMDSMIMMARTLELERKTNSKTKPTVAETKVGAKISADTASHMKTAHDHVTAAMNSMKSASDVLTTLTTSAAAEDSTAGKSAVADAAEPEILPLSLDWLQELKSLNETFKAA